MSNTDSQWDLPSTFSKLYVPVAVVLALLVIVLWLLGYGPGGRACAPAANPAAAVSAGGPATAAVPSPAAAPAAATPGSAVVAAAAPVASSPAAAVPAPAQAAAADLPAVAKLFFAVGSSKVGESDRARLDAIVAYLVAHGGAKVALSGFHDTKGNQAQNEELAYNRARAVRELLVARGIAKDRVVMAKPRQTTGDGTPEEARRVEVSVQP